MKDLISKVKKAAPKVKDLISKAKKALPGKVNDLISKAKKALPGKVQGLISKVKKAAPKVKGLISKVKNAVPKLKKAIVSKVKDILPKINGLKLYGNFCGPNYCGGQMFKGAEGPKCQWGVAPKDSLDSCCKLHDQCCGSPNTRGTRCNQEILSCLKNAKCEGAKCKVAQSVMKMTFATIKNKVCGDVLGKAASKAKPTMNKQSVIKGSPAVSVVTVASAAAASADDDAPTASAAADDDAPAASAATATADDAPAAAVATATVDDAPAASTTASTDDAPAPAADDDAPAASAATADDAPAPAATADDDAPAASAASAAADAPAASADADAPAASADADASAAEVKEHAVDEIIKSIPKTNMKLKQFQEKLTSFIAETNKEQTKIETDNRNNYNGVSVTLKNEQLRLESVRKSMKMLYAETERLNMTIQAHYKKLIADTSYIESLDEMRPSFLKSLEELASHIAAVKSTVDQKIYKDEYKDEMIGLLTDIHFTTHNVSGFVATAFINHYNKYKALIDKENVDYSSDMKRLAVLSNNYKVQAQKSLEIEKERSRLQVILNKLKSTLTLSISQRDEFERLVKDVVSIFNNNKIC